MMQRTVGLIVLLLGAASGLASAQGRAKPTMAVVAQEWLNGEVRTNPELRQLLEGSMRGKGFATGADINRRVASRDIRAADVIAGKIARDLPTAGIDGLVAAVLRGRITMADGAATYKATIEVRIVEVGSGGTLIKYKDTMSVTASVALAARKKALRKLLQKSWRKLGKGAELVSRGEGSVILRVDGVSESGAPLDRVLSALTDEPEIADARVLSRGGAQAVVSLQPASGHSDKSVAAALKRARRLRLRRAAAGQRGMAATLDNRAAPIALSIIGASPSTDFTFARASLVGSLKPLLADLMRTALDNSSLIAVAKRGRRRHAGRLKLGFDGKRLVGRLTLEGTSTTLSAPVAGAGSISAAVWELARKLHRAVGGRMGRPPMFPPRLRRGAKVASVDVLGVLAAPGKLVGNKGRARMVFKGKAPAKISVRLAGFTTKAGTSTGSAGVLSPKLDAAKLSRLNRPRAGRLHVEMTWGEGQKLRRDAVVVPVVVWPPGVIDERRPESLAALVNPSSAAVRRLLEAGFSATANISELHDVDRSLWLPIFTYATLAAFQPRVTRRGASWGRLRRVQPVHDTVRARGGDPLSIALLYASLAFRGGTDVSFWMLTDDVIVGLNTDMLSRTVGLPVTEVNRVVEYGGTIWLPISVASLSQGFDQAWEAGARRLRTGIQQGRFVGTVRAYPRSAPDDNFGRRRVVIDNPDAVATGVRTAVRDFRNRLEAGRAKLEGSAPKKAKNTTREHLPYVTQLVRMGASKRAIKLLGVIARKSPGLPRVESLLGVANAHAGNYGAAAKHFKKVGTKTGRLNLGLVTALLGKRDLALERLEREGKVGRKLARVIGLTAGAKGRVPQWMRTSDPMETSVVRLGGATLLRARAKSKVKLDRRLVTRALGLLRL